MNNRCNNMPIVIKRGISVFYQGNGTDDPMYRKHESDKNTRLHYMIIRV